MAASKEARKLELLQKVGKAEVSISLLVNTIQRHGKLSDIGPDQVAIDLARHRFMLAFEALKTSIGRAK